MISRISRKKKLPAEHTIENNLCLPCRALFRRPAFLAVAVFLTSLSLYIATLAPGLLWGGGDFAIFQVRAFSGEVYEQGPYGHSLWVILAHPFTRLPIRDPAWRANFAAAVFGSAALGFVFLSAYYLSRSLWFSLLATGALAFSHTFWTYAVMPKVYSLNVLLLAACIYLLLRWRELEKDRYLYFFAFLYGLSFLNHLVMATAAIGLITFVGFVMWPRRRSKTLWHSLLLVGFFFALGLSPYLYLIFQSGAAQSTGSAITSFFGGVLYPLHTPSALLYGLGWGIALGLYQFPVTLFIGFVGLYYLWRKEREAAALITFTVLGSVAFLLAATDPRPGGVYVWNLHYYLQAYVVVPLALAVGFKALWPRWIASKPWRQVVAVSLTLLLPVLLYAITPATVRAFWKNVPDFRPLPGRDNFTYVLSPWKHQETGARDFGEGILSALPPHSTLFADYSIWAVIHYLQVVEGARPDVELVKLPGKEQQVPFLLGYRDTPNLFLADTYRYYDIEGIQKHFEILPAGQVYYLRLK